MVLLDVTTIMKRGLPYLGFMPLRYHQTIWLSLLLIHTTYYKINHRSIVLLSIPLILSAFTHLFNLKEFLLDAQINRNPSVEFKDRLTLSGVWYRVRPKMIAVGFKPRKMVTDSKGREIYDLNLK
jgi:hypothetical protein